MIPFSHVSYDDIHSIPKLSPTHTKCRILKWEVAENDYVNENDTVLVVECSPDLYQDHKIDSSPKNTVMVIDTQDEGNVKNLIPLNTKKNEWLDVGTQIGLIDDDEEVDGDWMWQGYLK